MLLSMQPKNRLTIIYGGCISKVVALAGKGSYINRATLSSLQEGFAHYKGFGQGHYIPLWRYVQTNVGGQFCVLTLIQIVVLAPH